MDELKWDYQKIDSETGRMKYAPTNDATGEITGHHVFGLKEWFDEHPAERIALGWIKHIHKDTKDIEYNRRTQYLTKTTRWIDENTYEDEYHVMDKSEEMMRLEELTIDRFWASDDIIDFGGI